MTWKIIYDLATTDHIPYVCNVPMLSPVDSSISAGKLDWSNLTKEDLKEYTSHTDTFLGSIKLPKDAIIIVLCW